MCTYITGFWGKRAAAWSQHLWNPCDALSCRSTVGVCMVKARDYDEDDDDDGVEEECISVPSHLLSHQHTAPYPLKEAGLWSVWETRPLFVVRCAFVSHQPPISYHSSDDFQDKMLVSAVKQSEGLVFML